MALLLSNVEWPGESEDVRPIIAAILGVEASCVVSHTLVKRSLDARHGKQAWRAVYRVEVSVDEQELLSAGIPSCRAWTSRDAGRYGLDVKGPEKREWPSDVRPIVVGAGPAGLFCALYLAEAGAEVTLIERGGATKERIKAVNGHWRGKLGLDEDNNIVFGEGGAGTFSDGKIYTRRRDGELGYVFRRLVDFGADKSIMSEAWAHLGTDRVRQILPVFRARLEALGVEIRYHTAVTDLICEDGRAVGVQLRSGERVLGGPVIVAAGHSARDTAEALIRAGAAASPCPIAVGARIEHPQTLIDAAQYGGEDRADLPAASYRLTHSPDNSRKVHTFCMCPGGVVVPASNLGERTVVNGMSFSARRAFWANSAVIVAVQPSDYPGTDPLAGYRFQDAIERRAREMAGGTESAPAQRVRDFLDGKLSETLPKTSFAFGVTSVNLADLFPQFIVQAMRAAIQEWDAKIPGFAGSDGVLIAPETRTTSPVRFTRSEEGESTTVRGLYPVGEGAGYGGGIVSCALDGVRAARSIVDAMPLWSTGS